MFVNLRLCELEDPKGIAKDISEVGHWGDGDYEIIIKNDNDFEYVISLIKQSWNKNRK